MGQGASRRSDRRTSDTSRGDDNDSSTQVEQHRVNSQQSSSEAIVANNVCNTSPPKQTAVNQASPTREIASPMIQQPAQPAVQQEMNRFYVSILGLLKIRSESGRVRTTPSSDPDDNQRSHGIWNVLNCRYLNLAVIGVLITITINLALYIYQYNLQEKPELSRAEQLGSIIGNYTAQGVNYIFGKLFSND